MIKKIPTKEEVDKAIVNIEISIDKLNFSKLKFNTPEEFEKSIGYISSIFEGFSFLPRIIIPSSTSKSLFTSKVYRIRKYDESIKEILISEFSFPPINSASLSRLNYDGFPVFYCSPDPETALYETLEKGFKRADENKYYLSEWSFKEDLPIYVSIFLAGHYVNSAYNELSDKFLLEVIKEFGNISEEEKERLRYYCKSLATLFEKKDEKYYYLTAYIGHTYLYYPGNIRTDIFIYPSIALNKQKLNFGIQPNAVLHKMQLDKVFLFKVSDYQYEHKNELVFEYEMINRIGLNNNHGYLTWLDNLSKEEFEYFQKLFPIKID